MLKLSNIKIPAEEGLSSLPRYCAAALKAPETDITEVKPLRISVDSRRKSDVHFVCSVAVAVKNEKRFVGGKSGAALYEPAEYAFPYADMCAKMRPVVCGTGPAGLFAALMLSEAGLPPVILERGRETERRCRDVEKFWQSGDVDETSNVQFGEGGAGTFSDGKLNTGVNDLRIPYILRRFCEFGAPEDILWSAKPHIGTDMLRLVVVNMRKRLLSLGCEVRFENRLTGLKAENGALSSVAVESPQGEYEIPCSALVLAPGNSARDTFRMLYDCGVVMEPKPFAVGVRIEHLQGDMDTAQYGEAATLGTLPKTGYKLAVHTPDGRGVFTFCVCPGGKVVAAASEKGGVVTNGMSEHARAETNINGGLLVSVTPDDFTGLFGGMELQRELEKRAFVCGGGDGRAPAQTVGDFLKRRPSEKYGRVKPTYLPGTTLCSLWDVLPPFICEAIAYALPETEKKIRGFCSPDALLTAVETRSSSPVRICRDGTMQANIRGVFPCGEGGGWAGGITSSAVDGIKCAEALCRIIS